MSGAGSLYQELILEHGRKPRNFKAMAAPTHRAEGHNPLCGDKVVVFARVEDGTVREVTFQGQGCAISTASTSLMTEAVRGKTPAQAHDLFERFHDLVTGKTPSDPDDGLGKLEAFAGVSEFPMRVKCATLAWHTLEAALEGRAEPVSTE
jgi:nitrogen fixation protein NifU and related proteins